MRDYYIEKIMPAYQSEVDLRVMVSSYDQKLQFALQEMKEENRIFDKLQNALNDNDLKLMKSKQTQELHQDTINRGREQLKQLEEQLQAQQTEVLRMQTTIDDAAVDLGFHKQLLVEYEIKKKQEEAELEQKMLIDSEMCDLETKKSGFQCSEPSNLSERASLSRSRRSI